MDNLRELYESLPKTEREKAANWYKDANRFARELAETYGFTLKAIAGVIAALSPNTAWPRNKSLAISLLKTGDCKTIGTCKRKALSILAGQEPEKVLNGKKTVNFYHNIRNPRSKKHVTIDTHAARAYFGLPATKQTANECKKILARKNQYEKLAKHYSRLADELGLIASEVQAIIWVAYREKSIAPRFRKLHG